MGGQGISGVGLGILLLASSALAPAGAQIGSNAGKPGQGATADTPPQVRRSVQDRAAAPAANDKPIVSDEEFDKSLPPLSDDMNAPLEPMAPADPAAPPAELGVDAADPLGVNLPPAGDQIDLAAPLPPLIIAPATGAQVNAAADYVLAHGTVSCCAVRCGACGVCRVVSCLI